MGSNGTSDVVNVSAEAAEVFAVNVLVANGVPEKNAKIVARCLVAADLRGVDTHGINRIPSYMTRMRQGLLDVKAEPELKQVTPAAALVDAKNGFGFVASQLGMSKAIEMTQIYGIGMVSIKHSNHFGMAAWIVKQALDAGMMSLVFTNSSPALAPWGGRNKLIGVSPLACGAPGEHDFILDMAPSLAARGKIFKAQRRGEKIPMDWSLDKDGKPTDDPTAALGGTMQPMGGPKGFGLAVMMDVFSGVLSGSAFAGHVTGPLNVTDAANVGHSLVAIKPDLFMSTAEFRERLEYLYQRVTGAEKSPTVDRIYFPGEIEQLKEQERRKTGIPFVQAEVDTLNKEAASVGVSALPVLS
ncbi:hypothetical protein PRZ48_004880 [Zasmidium cellare]|uniref:Malate dehydrogenase n=1 Tax=Zasmidium cellare TaxID=395010 RepID=A0ABR0ERT2_ZASCE|nr:hypothetical protein PRZ48_004880 [Zasmidium cellare]